MIYPVLMTRCGHWDGVPPGADEPQPIALPPLGEIGEGERYVPAGWFGSGGDPLATDGLPARRFWVDGFVIGRDPLTYTDLLADLETMSQRGQLAHARRVAPLAKGKRTTIVEVRETDEGFRAVPRPDSPWSPDWPVVDLNWFQARAWADWRRDSRGRPWRLPHSLEWEKAARGVDRRLLPWGDAFDPTWANVTDSFPDRAHPCGVADFPADLSPYGVRGLAGNTRDWCYDVYRRHGLPRGVEHVLIETVPSEGKNHNCRGGAWSSKGSFCRPATRMAGPPTASGAQIGVRLARPFPAPADQMTSSIIL